MVPNLIASFLIAFVGLATCLTKAALWEGMRGTCWKRWSEGLFLKLCLNGKYIDYMVFRFYISCEYTGQTNTSEPLLCTTIVSLRFKRKQNYTNMGTLTLIRPSLTFSFLEINLSGNKIFLEIKYHINYTVYTSFTKEIN